MVSVCSYKNYFCKMKPSPVIPPIKDHLLSKENRFNLACTVFHNWALGFSFAPSGRSHHALYLPSHWVQHSMTKSFFLECHSLPSSTWYDRVFPTYLFPNSSAAFPSSSGHILAHTFLWSHRTLSMPPVQLVSYCYNCLIHLGYYRA